MYKLYLQRLFNVLNIRSRSALKPSDKNESTIFSHFAFFKKSGNHAFLFFLMLLFFNSIAFSQTPVASFPFNGNANDASGNGNNGILGGETANPGLTTDRFGNANSAYEFGGYYNKNWIRVPNSNSLKFTKQLSISLWFSQCKFDGMDGWGSYNANGHHILFSKAGDGISANPGIFSGIYTDKNNLLNIGIGNKNGYGQALNINAGTVLNCFDLCEWIHYVVVINNDILKMYINGRLTITQTINPADFTNANTQDFFIGRMFGSSIIWYPFRGKIDDINIYNTALTQKEVTSLCGNYIDPLATNNTITLDSVRVINLACGGSNNGSISIYPNSNNAPYQFSIDGGTTYQSSGIYSKLASGKYNVKIKTNCNEKDTIINIGTSIEVKNTVSICEGQNYLGHLTSGIYIDTIYTSNKCDSIITTNLTVNTKPTVIITPAANSQDIFSGESTDIALTSNEPTTTFTWIAKGSSTSVSGYSSGTGSKIEQILLNPGPDIETVTYSITPHNGNCDGLPVDFNIVVKSNLVSIIIPNVFTPNNDGFNDTFGPVTQGIKSLEMNINDRNGRIVYKIDLIDGRWDGNMTSGGEAPQGVYFYYLNALGYNYLEYIRQGNVNLYRDNINLTPNPVKSTSILNLSGRLTGKKVISIYSASGFLLKIFNTPEDIIYLDFTSLNPGLYIIKAADSDQTLVVKFIKE
jgi:gliding motility-associated-like protein